MSSTLDLIVSNNKTGVVNQTAVSFDLDLEAHLNVSMTDFVVHPGIEELFVFNINKTVDNVDMYPHNYNTLFTSILKNFANDFNIRDRHGFKLDSYAPDVVARLRKVVQNSTVSPFVEDKFLLVGFSVKENPVLGEEVLEEVDGCRQSCCESVPAGPLQKQCLVKCGCTANCKCPNAYSDFFLQ